MLLFSFLVKIYLFSFTYNRFEAHQHKGDDMSNSITECVEYFDGILRQIYSAIPRHENEVTDENVKNFVYALRCLESNILSSDVLGNVYRTQVLKVVDRNCLGGIGLFLSILVGETREWSIGRGIPVGHGLDCNFMVQFVQQVEKEFKELY